MPGCEHDEQHSCAPQTGLPDNGQMSVARLSQAMSLPRANWRHDDRFRTVLFKPPISLS